MNVNKLFPSRFIKADDLGGKRITLAIHHVIMEEVRNEDGKEQKAIVYFEKAKKGLLLNKTNAMAIAAMYGTETDAWAGHRVTLYSAKVRAFGQQVDAVRVDEPPAIPAGKANGNGNGNAQHAPDEVPDALNEEVPDDEIDINAIAGM